MEGCCNDKVNDIEIENNVNDEKELKEFDDNQHLIIDSHCHIQEDSNNFDASIKLPFEKILLMGTTMDDWDKVNGLTNQYQSILPKPTNINDNNNNSNSNKFIRCFGIHPWFAYQLHPPLELIGKPIDPNLDINKLYKINDEWYDRLKENLIKYPDSIVGEVGIDKVSKVRATGKNELVGQMDIFTKQIQIASELDRVVSLHCVQLHGKLLDYFQSLPLSQFPRKIALHTFGGKPSTVQQFSKMKENKGDRFYFGISFINLSSSKINNLIKSIPDDKLLLESDQNNPFDAKSSLFRVVKTISVSKQWSIKDTIERTRLNTLRFLAK